MLILQKQAETYYWILFSVLETYFSLWQQMTNFYPKNKTKNTSVCFLLTVYVHNAKFNEANLKNVLVKHCLTYWSFFLMENSLKSLLKNL